LNIDRVYYLSSIGFFWILLVLQFYSGYRILRHRKLTAGREPDEGERSASRRASIRFSLFLTALNGLSIIWVLSEIAAGRLPWFLRIAVAIASLGITRQALAATQESRPVAGTVLLGPSARFAAGEKVTPEFIATVLEDQDVINAMKVDLSRIGQIGYKEVWRLGLITPDQDKFDPRPSQLSLQERLGQFQQDSNYRSNLMGRVPFSRAAALYNPGSFNIQPDYLTITGGAIRPEIGSYPGWSYRLSAKRDGEEYLRLREIEIDTDRPSARNRSRFLPQFLREDGLPLKQVYADGDPLTSDRGGAIVLNDKNLRIIHPTYFVQRKLMDDRGTLLDIGFDESFSPEGFLGIKMQPAVSARLVRHVEANGYTPILRYRFVPYASDFRFPILDTPMTMNGWADLFVDAKGNATLFIARENTPAEWNEMMAQLKQLLFAELAKKDYHLLGLTQDNAHLNDYLAKKRAVMARYFIIMNWVMP